MAHTLQRTTISIPKALLAGVDRLVQDGLAENRSQLIASAIEAELRRREREHIYAQFAGIASDEDYRADAAQIMREFATADREAWDALAHEDAR
jgi:metal-responsive CopG/Arc/MetJ family transcriptional regulator